MPVVNTTAFPSGIALAAAWDADLANGHALGQESGALGRDMLLGQPTVNINGRMGVAYIRGLQGEGIIATVKHFVGKAHANGAKNIRITGSNIAKRTLPASSAIGNRKTLAPVNNINPTGQAGI